MSKKWTVEEAKAYIAKVVKGKQQVGLRYCSAIDFIVNYTSSQINIHPLANKENDHDVINSSE